MLTLKSSINRIYYIALCIFIFLSSFFTIFAFNTKSVNAYRATEYKLEDGDVRDKQVWDALKKAGFSDASAAAVMGNLMQESGLNAGSKAADSSQKGGKHSGYTYGMMQVGGARADSMISYVEGKYGKWTHAGGQMEWLVNSGDLDSAFKHYTGLGTSYYYSYKGGGKTKYTGSYPKHDSWAWWPSEKISIEDFKKDTDIDHATEVFCRVYERAGKPNMKRRKEYAKKFFKMFAGSAPLKASKGKPENFNIINLMYAPTADYKLSDGTNAATTEIEEKNREALNKSILADVGNTTPATTKHSLYDRFGPKLPIIEYLGEEGASITAIDHIVSYGIQDRLSDISVFDVKESYDTYLSTQVYKGRPIALTKDSLQSGLYDERVKLYNSERLGKLYSVEHAKALKGIASFIVTSISVLIGPTLLKAGYDIVIKIVDNETFQYVMQNSIKVLLPLFIIFVIFYLVRLTFGFLKGRTSLRQAIGRIIIVIIAIGMTTVFITKAHKVVDISYRVATFTDDLMNAAINDQHKGDEVIYSADTKNGNTMEAVIWKTALFQPWCKALFGNKYENLYTQFADKPEENKMPQSHEDVSAIRNASSANSSSGNNSANNNDISPDIQKLWVGDSRTVGIAASAGVSYKKSMNMLVGKNNNLFLAKDGASVDLLKDNIKRIKAGNADLVYVNLGVNSLGKADEYIKSINELAKSKQVYVLSVGPTSGKYKKLNKDINAFNKKVRNGVAENVKFIDVNSHIASSFETTDGLHYSKNTYSKIFDFVNSTAKPTATQDNNVDGSSLADKSADETPHYDSATLTGDVFVDIGGGEKIKNWAAYAWSTTSIYHIGHEIYGNAKYEDKETKNFPVAMTTYTNKNIYADTFRWIDAKMNISPEYYSGESKTVVESYSASKPWITHWYKQSWKMLLNAILLLGLIPVIIMRLKAFFSLLITFAKGLYYSFQELAMPNTGFSTFWSKFKDSAIGYFYHSLQLVLLINIYELFIGKGGPFFILVYVCLCFIITATTPADIYKAVVNTKFQAKRILGSN